MKSKTTAILLALFLGGLGAHHFYLKHWGRGILYLLFCWTYVPSILGLIDAVYYLVAGGKDFEEAPASVAPSVTSAPPVTQVPPRQNTAPSIQQAQNSFTIVGTEVEEPEQVEQKHGEEVTL